LTQKFLIERLADVGAACDQVVEDRLDSGDDFLLSGARQNSQTAEVFDPALAGFFTGLPFIDQQCRIQLLGQDNRLALTKM